MYTIENMSFFDKFSNNEKNFESFFWESIENITNEYIQKGIIQKEQFFEQIKKQKKVEEQCPQNPIKAIKHTDIKETSNKILHYINKHVIDSFKERLLCNMLKLNSKMQVECSIRYRILYSIKVKKKTIVKNVEEKTEHINNLYKILKRNKSFFLNEYLLIKKVYSSEFGHFYIGKNVKERPQKKYLLKLFCLNTCLQKKCPVYTKNEAFLGPYINKILDEIFFLQYLHHQNIITIKTVSFDTQKNMFLVIFPYIKQQSMYFKTTYNLYSVKKKIKVTKHHVQIFLYSEKYIRKIFKKIYNTISYILKKNVAYVDLKPENLLLSDVPPTEVIPIYVKRKEGKIKRRKEKKRKQESKNKKKNDNLADKEKEKKTESHKENDTSNKSDEQFLHVYNTFNSYAEKKREKKKFNACNLFLYKKRKTEKRNKSKKYIPFEHINIKTIENKHNKYIYNVKVSKCFLFDKDINNIFFKKSYFDDSFYMINPKKFIQIFVKQKQPIYTHIKKKTKEALKQNEQMLVSKINQPINNVNILNKIKGLQFFTYRGNYVQFLKFYWLYYYETNEPNDGFLYLSLYFIHKLYFTIYKKKKTSPILLGEKEKTIYSLNESKQIYNGEKKETEGEKIWQMLTNEENAEILKKAKNKASNNKEESNSGRLLEIPEKGKKQSELCYKKKMHNENKNKNKNENVSLKLIDFDTCLFKIKDHNFYNCGTYAFNAFECLFNINKTDIILSKKIGYTIGCTLYVFLFGKLPFGNTIFEIHENMGRNKVSFPKYRQLNNDLKDLIKKLLTRKLKKRLNFKKIISHKWFENSNEAAILKT